MDRNDLYKEFFDAIISSNIELPEKASAIAKIIAEDLQKDVTPDIETKIAELEKKLANKKIISSDMLYVILREHQDCLNNQKFIELMRPFCKGHYIRLKYFDEIDAETMRFLIDMGSYISTHSWILFVLERNTDERGILNLIALYEANCQKMSDLEKAKIYRYMK